MDFDLNIQDDQWELSLDIDDSDLRLTPVLRPSSSTRVETSPSSQKPVRIIPEYTKKVVEDVSENENFKSGPWVSATDYVNANGGVVSGCLGDIKNFLNNEKLDQVVAIIKSCSPNVIGDLTVTMKDLSGTIPGTIHHKVIDEGGYGNDITVGAALILANVSVFYPKPSMHYLNITMRNVVKVFRKDAVPESENGSG
ncbi:zf-CCHC domain-containing protein [Tanacetum coccineum]